jgi:hypothetical protein
MHVVNRIHISTRVRFLLLRNRRVLSSIPIPEASYTECHVGLPQPFHKRRLALYKPEHDRLFSPFTHHYSNHNHSFQCFNSLYISKTVSNKTHAIRNISSVRQYCCACRILKPLKYCSSYIHQVNLHLKSLTFAVYVCFVYFSHEVATMVQHNSKRA